MVESITVELSAERTPLAVESAALLAAIADPLRLGIVRFLAAEGERCVCDIQATFPVASNLLSYHLKALRQARLLECEKRGRWVHYWVAADAGARLHAALPLGV